MSTKSYVEAGFAELDVELHGFAQCVFDASYLGDLAAYVEVYELEAVCHLTSLHEVDGFEQFGAVEAEFRLVASAFFPFAGA